MYSMLDRGFWIQDFDLFGQCFKIHDPGCIVPSPMGTPKLRRRCDTSYCLLIRENSCQFVANNKKDRIPHHPPKSSKAIISGSTPRLSSVACTAFSIMGGPHR